MTERAMILIPAYNAAKTVPDVIRATKEIIADVVVVNDGSRDETASSNRTRSPSTWARAETIERPSNST